MTIHVAGVATLRERILETPKFLRIRLPEAGAALPTEAETQFIASAIILVKFADYAKFAGQQVDIRIVSLCRPMTRVRILGKKETEPGGSTANRMFAKTHSRLNASREAFFQHNAGTTNALQNSPSHTRE